MGQSFFALQIFPATRSRDKQEVTGFFSKVQGFSADRPFDEGGVENAGLMPYGRWCNGG
ncbi:hypothetical protein [Pelotomaculum sp. FP]|uniref:hypothetical protein n=1 Tax=Pelotomaculum sp. FP TaxID=261474 RepID=UPI001864A238|nr:hypothetical protein [Pelotomaculum sp. FP]